MKYIVLDWTKGILYEGCNEDEALKIYVAEKEKELVNSKGSNCVADKVAIYSLKKLHNGKEKVGFNIKRQGIMSIPVKSRLKYMTNI